MMILFMQTATTHQPSEWACQQTQALMPDAWYESNRLTTVLYYLLAIPLFALFWLPYRLSPPVYWSITGMGIYGIGWLADTITTWKAFRLRAEFQKRNLIFPLQESSPLMEAQPRLLGQLFNLASLYSLAVFVAAWIVPALGIAAGLAHIGAALNNERKRQRLELQLTLIDRQQGRVG